MKKLKKIAATGAAIATLLATASLPALAANDYCGASSNGCTNAQSNTTCSGAGAFGYFGKDNSLAGGANGPQTGLNNSSLCGNQQGNP